MTDNEKEFIKELEVLSRKYKLRIWGCGCCGSPDLVELEEKEISEEAGYSYSKNLEWIYPDNYEWKEGERPVK